MELVQKNPMEMIKFNLERQNEQGQALVEIINHIEKIEDNVEFKFSEMSSMVQEVRDSVTLTYEEQLSIQKSVHSASIDFAKESLTDTEPTREELSKEIGKFRRAIWKKLKVKMNVPRYTSIRRIDFPESMDFVTNLRMKDFLNI